MINAVSFILQPRLIKTHCCDDPVEAGLWDSHWSSSHIGLNQTYFLHINIKQAEWVRIAVGRHVFVLKLTEFEISEHSGVVNNSSTFSEMKRSSVGVVVSGSEIWSK